MEKIAVTGYYGTGSSAVVDLLAEVENVQNALGIRYEHTNLNCRDGIFDLETLLFSDNTNYYSRDMALNRFYKEMYKQYNYDFGWYGSFKKLFGKNKYMDIVNEFVNSISIVGGKKSLAHTTKIKYSLGKSVLQIGAKICFNHPISKLGRIYVHDGDPQRFLTANHDEFIVAAQKFINEYFDLCQDGENIMVYDHLLFPEQCGVVDRFFDDEFKLIIVDRDPRDIYYSDKYIWNTARLGYQSMPLPKEVHAFCKYWDVMHNKMLRNLDSKKILLVRFEDLIYNYEEEIEHIFKFCGIDKSMHKNKKKYFDPSKSIKNTQVFNMVDAKEEEKIITEILSDYIYEFPYKIKNNIKETFD